MIHDDTVLQVATYAKKPSLVLRPLQDLPDCHLDKLTCQNHTGNTILHEIAILNQSLEVAKRVLEKAPGLLYMRNNLGVIAHVQVILNLCPSPIFYLTSQ